MNVEMSRIMGAYKKVQNIRDHMKHVCPGPQEPAVRIMDLHYVIQDIYGLKIEMLEVAFAGTYLKGKVERYNNGRARVLVRSGLSDFEKRWIAVKELCHLVIDEEEDFSTLGADTLDDIFEDMTLFAVDGVGQRDPSSELISEGLALLAAYELVYPGEYHADDIAKLADSSTSISKIGLQHKIPAYVIQQSLQNRGTRDRGFAAMAAEAAQALDGSAA